MHISPNSCPSASNFKSFSSSLEQLFLSVSQNNFGNKIPFLHKFVFVIFGNIALFCIRVEFFLNYNVLTDSSCPYSLNNQLQYPFPVYHSSRGENKKNKQNIKSKCKKMSNFQDLPDELVLKILRSSETKDLISCGQVSQRIRKISHDGSLWITANLEKKIVKTELLKMILSKGCQNLNVSNSTIVGSLSLNEKSQLRVLDFSQSTWARTCSGNIGVLEEILFSCRSLQELKMERLLLTPTMANNICKNGKTLQKLNLKHSVVKKYTDGGVVYGPPSGFASNYYLQEIIKRCQELREIDFNGSDEGLALTSEDLKFLVENISPNIEKLNLKSSCYLDEFVKILLTRCNKIKSFSLMARFIADISLTNIRQHLHLTLEELSLGCGFEFLSLNGFLELKSMPRLKILNLYNRKADTGVQTLREHLPHLKIHGIQNQFCLHPIYS